MDKEEFAQALQDQDIEDEDDEDFMYHVAMQKICSKEIFAQYKHDYYTNKDFELMKQRINSAKKEEIKASLENELRKMEEVQEQQYGLIRNCFKRYMFGFNMVFRDAFLIMDPNYEYVEEEVEEQP